MQSSCTHALNALGIIVLQVERDRCPGRPREAVRPRDHRAWPGGGAKEPAAEDAAPACRHRNKSIVGDMQSWNGDELVRSFAHVAIVCTPLAVSTSPLLKMPLDPEQMHHVECQNC